MTTITPIAKYRTLDNETVSSPSALAQASAIKRAQIQSEKALPAHIVRLMRQYKLELEIAKERELNAKKRLKAVLIREKMLYSQIQRLKEKLIYIEKLFFRIG